MRADVCSRTSIAIPILLAFLVFSPLTKAQFVEVEPNNSIPQSNIGILDAPVSGQFSVRYPSTGFDNDYFQFNNLEEGILRISLSPGGTTSCCDGVYFEVQNSLGTVLVADYVPEGQTEV